MLFRSARFTTENGQIRFALAAVKNVGEAAIRHLIAERNASGPFKSFGDFLRRLNEGELNRKMIESLIRSSALDSFGIPRSQLIAALEPFTNQLANARRQNMEGQMSLFEFGPAAENVDAEPDYPAIPDFDPGELLAMEKEMLGLYVTGHPLDEYDEAIRKLTTLNSSAFADLAEGGEEGAGPVPAAVADGDRVIMAGMLAARKNKTTKSNELMSFLTIEDLYGQYEVLVFPKTLSACASCLTPGAVLLIGGRLSIREDDTPKLVAEQVAALDKGDRRPPQGFTFRPENGGNRYRETPAGRPPAPGPLPPSRKPPAAPPHPATDPAAEAAADAPQANRRALAIRYNGNFDDAGYKRLMAMLAYFQGDTPVRVFLPAEERFVNMPHNCWIELTNEVLRYLADRYGPKNLAII